MIGYVVFDSWAGRTRHPVTILKQCAKRSKVRFEEQAFWRPAGHIQYVPNSAIEKVDLEREWYGEPAPTATKRTPMEEA